MPVVFGVSTTKRITLIVSTPSPVTAHGEGRDGSTPKWENPTSTAPKLLEISLNAGDFTIVLESVGAASATTLALPVEIKLSAVAELRTHQNDIASVDHIAAWNADVLKASDPKNPWPPPPPPAGYTTSKEPLTDLQSWYKARFDALLKKYPHVMSGPTPDEPAPPEGRPRAG